MKKKLKRPPRRPLKPQGTSLVDELLRNGRLAEATDQLIAMAEVDPKQALIPKRLAEIFELQGRELDALRQLDRVIELDAADASIWKTTGKLLLRLNEPAQAIGAFQNSIKLDPSDAEVHHELARSFYKLGDVDSAVHPLELSTKRFDNMDPWLALATLAPSCSSMDHQRVLQIRSAFSSRLAESSVNNDRTDAAGYAERVVRTPVRSIPKIAFMSSWFPKANYMKPVWALINHLDRSRFQIHLLTDAGADELPGYIANENDQVHETAIWSNQELVDRVVELGIDLLIDLNAYSTPERLGVFCRPLPFRAAAWFNMYATSGMPGIEFLIGDSITVQPHEECWYCERVVRLSQSYLSFQIAHETPPVVDPPCAKTGHITFGSLVSQYKLNADVIDAWSEILRGVPESRLLLANVELDTRSTREYVQDQFTRRGINPDRLEMRGRAEHYKFLTYYDSIDLALDAFPYNGGTTTTEAIWQGVPVMTFAGDRWASRTSASLLHETHLSDFVARDRNGFVAQTITLANHPLIAERLLALRHSMRQELFASPVCDAERFAEAMHAAFETILAADAE